MRMRRLVVRCASALMAVVVGGGVVAPREAAAQTQMPRFYAWDPIEGPARQDARFVHMVRVPCRFMSGTQAADWAADQIANRKVGGPGNNGPLPNGALTIFLQDFGWVNSTTPLVLNSADAMVIPPTTPYEAGDPWGRDARAQPWMQTGRLLNGQWMDAFIARYKQRQAANPAIPNPDRVILDLEDVLSGCCSHNYLLQFKIIAADPRWATMPVPGYGKQTLAQVYAAARTAYAMPVDPQQAVALYWPNGSTRSAADGLNRLWYSWWVSVYHRVYEGALDEVCYAKVRAAFPGCGTSNYVTSSGTDRVGDPWRGIIDRGAAGMELEPLINDAAQTVGIWATHAWTAFSTRISPSLYVVDPAHVAWANGTPRGETPWQSAVRVHRTNLQSMIDSFGGGRQGLLSPWIMFPYQTMSEYGGFEMLPHHMLDQLAMLRSKAVPELLLWQTPRPDISYTERWNVMTRLIGMAYRPRVTSYVVEKGFEPPASHDPARLHHSLKNQVNVSGDPELKVQIAVTFQNIDPGAAGLRINVDARFSCEGEGTVSIRRADGTAWRKLGTFQYDNDHPETFRSFTAPNGPFYIGADGTATVRLTLDGQAARPWPSTVAAAIDLVQVVELDATMVEPVCEADLDGDGWADARDLMLFMEEFEKGDSDADADGNGTLEMADLEEYVRRYLACVAP